MFDKNVYISRRSKLKEMVGHGIILLPGNVDSPMNYSANTFKFRQDSSFLYFFGLDHENLAGIIDCDNNTETIFGNDADIDDIIWMGPQEPLLQKAKKVGVNNCQPFDKLHETIAEAILKGRWIHFLPPYRAENKILLEKLTGIQHGRLREHTSEKLIRAVIQLRSVKEAEEIEEIEKAAAIGYKMHTTAMKMAREGIYEREIAGVIEGIALSHGGMVSFPVILSRNGETLHNHYHGNLLKKGDLLLIDAGAETEMHYASDFTRVVPVGGKFSPMQRDIYQVVLNANNNATAAIRPGVTYRSVHLLAARTIAEGLKDLGLMKGNIDDAVTNGAHAMFFPHGLGHMMGLDVHDMEDLGENLVGYDDKTIRSTQFGTAYLRLGKELKPGYVLTNEPGIYFIPALIDKWHSAKINHDYINFDKVNAYRNFGGIRLEDDILVTNDGCRLLGKRIPIDPEEIEEFMAD